MIRTRYGTEVVIVGAPSPTQVEVEVKSGRKRVCLLSELRADGGPTEIEEALAKAKAQVKA